MNANCNKPYIYLDWNAFINLQNPAHPYYSKANITIRHYKEKGYSFPYSEGHMRDLFSKTGFQINEYSSSKFEHITKITSNDYIGLIEFNDKLTVIEKYAPKYIFNYFQNMENGEESYISEIIKKHDIYKQLRGNLHNSNFRASCLLSSDPSLQKNSEFLNIINTTDESFLKENFEHALKIFWNINNSGDYSWEYLLTMGFRFLDFTTLFQEKVNQKNSPYNIMNDGLHVYFSQNAEFIVSNDKNFSRKYLFFKDLLNLKTGILSLEEFSCNNIQCINKKIIAL